MREVPIMRTIDMDINPRKAVIDSPLSEILHGDPNGFGDIIKCPICGFDYGHIQDVKILTRIAGESLQR